MWRYLSGRALTAAELVGAILALFGAIAALPGRDAGVGSAAGELAPGAGGRGRGGWSNRLWQGAVGGCRQTHKCQVITLSSRGR